MKIVVCMKQVPATSKVDIDPETGAMKRMSGETRTNPYDLFALETALAKLVPRVNSREHCRRFYKTVAPYLDPGGFVLYETAAKLTRFNISTEFATEDTMGKFEEMDGYRMLRYLTADRFGSVEYEIVAPCYEEAVSLHTDYTSPEYLAFEKKLYEKTLRELGFEKLLPEERAPQKNMNKRKEKVEER